MGIKEFRRQTRQKHRAFLTWLKSCIGCEACGRAYKNQPYLIELHHHSGGKRDAVSRMVSDRRGIGVILKEIARCRFLCVVCHKGETHGAARARRVLRPKGKGVGRRGQLAKDLPSLRALYARWDKEVWQARRARCSPTGRPNRRKDS